MASSDDPLRAEADPLLLPFLRRGDAAASDICSADSWRARAAGGRPRDRRKLGVTLSRERRQRAPIRTPWSSPAGRPTAGGLVISGRGRRSPHRRFQNPRRGDRTTAADYLRRLTRVAGGSATKLRYLLTHRPRLAIWRARDRDWLCGLSHWGKRPRRDSDGVDQARGRVVSAGRQEARFALCLVNGSGSAVRLGAHSSRSTGRLTPTLAGRGARDSEQARPTAISSPIRPGSRRPISSQLSRAVVDRDPLPPPRQRTALLLNLRDAGAGGGRPLSAAGVATVRQIAAVLEALPVDQFAEDWERPWDDARISHQLGIERQQVVNLRRHPGAWPDGWGW